MLMLCCRAAVVAAVVVVFVVVIVVVVVVAYACRQPQDDRVIFCVFCDLAESSCVSFRPHSNLQDEILLFVGAD